MEISDVSVGFGLAVSVRYAFWMAGGMLRPRDIRHRSQLWFYAQQQDCKIYGFDERHFDPESLDRCVRELYSAEPVRLSAGMRSRQRRFLASAHREIYEKVLA